MDTNKDNYSFLLSGLKDLCVAIQKIQKGTEQIPKSDSPINIFTISEAAQILKCKERAIKHHLYESRDLKYLKIGREVRIREEDLRDFLVENLILCKNDQEILR